MRIHGATFFWLVPAAGLPWLKLASEDRRWNNGRADHCGLGKMLIGNIRSRTALRLIREWAVLHRAALEVNWANVKARKPLDRIPPLE
jgi:hypothetical protein